MARLNLPPFLVYPFWCSIVLPLCTGPSLVSDDDGVAKASFPLRHVPASFQRILRGKSRFLNRTMVEKNWESTPRKDAKPFGSLLSPGSFFDHFWGLFKSETATWGVDTGRMLGPRAPLLD